MKPSLPNSLRRIRPSVETAALCLSVILTASAATFWCRSRSQSEQWSLGTLGGLRLVIESDAGGIQLGVSWGWPSDVPRTFHWSVRRDATIFELLSVNTFERRVTRRHIAGIDFECGTERTFWEGDSISSAGYRMIGASHEVATLISVSLVAAAGLGWRWRSRARQRQRSAHGYDVMATDRSKGETKPGEKRELKTGELKTGQN